MKFDIFIKLWSLIAIPNAILSLFLTASIALPCSHPSTVWNHLSPETELVPDSEQSVTVETLAQQIQKFLFSSTEKKTKESQLDKQEIQKQLHSASGETKLKAAEKLAPIVTTEDGLWLWEAFLAQKELEEREEDKLRQGHTRYENGRAVIHYDRSGLLKRSELENKYHDTMAFLAEALCRTRDQRLAPEVFCQFAPGYASDYMLKILGAVGTVEMIPFLRTLQMEIAAKGYSANPDLEAAIQQIKYSLPSGWSISTKAKPWLRRILQLKSRRKADQKYCENLFQPLLDACRIPISIFYTHESSLYWDSEAGDPKPYFVALSILAASLAATTEDEFRENLNAIADLITHVRKFEHFKGSRYVVSRAGFSEDLIIATLPFLAQRAVTAEKFRERLQEEKEAVHRDRSVRQIVRGYEGWCSEDDAAYGATFEKYIALPAAEPSPLPLIKCVVVDGDETLWGGILGEVGIEGIQVDEPRQQFQQGLLKLKKKGVLLAISSKNKLEDVQQALKKHPNMVVKEKDFVEIRADRRDKAAHLREIAKELNIGLDSIAFIDDNPVERALIRSQLPQVFVPELPGDKVPPSLTEALLTDFVSKTTTKEDERRTELYAQRRHIKELLRQGVSPEQARRDLQFQVTIEELKESSGWGREREEFQARLDRVVQLIQKTNQFNLTTRRHDQRQIEKFLGDKDTQVFVLSLKTKLGDAGMLGVMILKKLNSWDHHFSDLPMRWDQIAWAIDTFCMSCRFAGHSLELAFLAYVIQKLQKSRAPWLIGEYRPTDRNGLVAAFYPNMGFSPMASGKEAGSSSESQFWKLDLRETAIPRPPWIAIEGFEEDLAASSI